MENIRKILIPTDFSDGAKNSLNYGINLAKAVGAASGTPAQVVVLHCYQVPIATNPVPLTTLGTTYVPDQVNLLHEVQQRAEEEMKELEINFLQNAGVPFECILNVGPVVDNINQVVKEHAIDMVLMATHNASKLEQWIGDLPVYALEKCKAPLLLIPEKVVFVPIRRLAFATDLKKILHTKVYEKLKYLAHTFKAHLIILNVNTDLKDLSEKEAEELQHIKKELQGMEFHFQFIEGENAEEAILNFVHHEEIDVVAAVPRHHGFFEGLFHSSVTKHLALNTQIPLLAIHE